MEVKQEVCPSKYVFRLGPRNTDVFMPHAPGTSPATLMPILLPIARLIARPVARVQYQLLTQSILFHPLRERRQRRAIALLIAAAAKVLQPVDVAAQPPQTLRVLHIHPEVSAHVRETRHVEWRN